ncbi:MAG: response regulator [Pseudarcicella sp.]|nr:response regulator [Pseudarcicella sp.]MBP6410489.1 response regulator [Pseudarcicella sp.]
MAIFWQVIFYIFTIFLDIVLLNFNHNFIVLKYTILKKLALFIVLIISCFCSFAQESKYPFNSISVDNGLNHTDATFLGQDKSGFIWISTYGGLNRYDGYEFKSFYNGENANKNVYFNRISNFFIDNEGLIWLSTQGGIACFDTRKEQFLKLSIPYEKKNAINPVKGIVKVKEQIYCLYENGELITYNLGENELIISKNNLPKTKFKSDFITTNSTKDEVWFGGAFGLIAIKSNNEIFQIVLPNNIGATSVYITKNNQLIVGAVNGFFKADKSQVFSKNSNVFTYYSINKSSISPKLQVSDDLPLAVNDIIEYKNILWLATANGLLSTNLSNPTQLFSYQNSDLNPYFISSNHISSLLVDASGSLWVGTFGGGICNTDLNPKYFQTIRKEPLSANTLSGHYVRAIQESKDGLIWMGQHSHGLNMYNPKTGLYKHFFHNPSNSNSLISNNVRSLLSSNDGKIWVGTDAGISILNPQTSNFEKITDNMGEGKSITDNVIFSLCEDKYGQVWAGSWSNGLSCIKKTADGKYKVSTFYADKGSKNRLAGKRVTFVYADALHSDVLIGTEKGLDQFFLNTTGEVVSVKHFQAFDNKEASLSSEYIWPIVRSKDAIWVGTLGGGLNKIIPQKNGYTATHYTTADGLPSNDVESLLLDKKGDLWIGGRGISHFDTQTKTFTNYDVNDGLQSNSFKIGSATYGQSGNMYFGGINGMSYFNPERIAAENQQITLALSDLIVNNKSIKANVAYDEKVVMEQSINDVSELELSHLENNFVIKFTALHFTNPGKCKYRYKLEGYNNDWVYVSSSNRSAAFSNLEYDTYNFLVEASLDGINWSKLPHELEITVTPPFWKSGFARFVYLMMALGLLYGVFYYLKKWVNLKNDYDKRIFEEQKTEELHQNRLDFFTNISHEFRTPLTLITSPLENLIYNEPDHQGRQKTYKVIYSNAKRLLGLINELMDFRKVETEIVDLHITKSNICTFTKDIANEFQELAYLRGINFRIDNFGKLNAKESLANESEEVYFDKKIVEKILVNLIGNAFKYSEDGSAIKVDFYSNLNGFSPIFSNEFKINPDIESSDFWWIKVQDNGIGITKESIGSIFDRYYRVSEFEEDKHLGSGIGLALVKSLVNLHKGAIWVYSERNKGTEILVGFSKNINVYDKSVVHQFDDYEIDTDQIQSLLEVENINVANEEPLLNALEETEPILVAKEKILIVEDNQEMRSFLKENFEPEYEVIEAVDGVDGLEKAKVEFPDCIITDLMMPRMDGIELCQQLRKRIEISHLPIIMLTAKDTIDSRMEGAESGADVYFTKPFSFRILKLTVRNILEKHKGIKNRYQKDVFVQARELVSNQKEKDFIDNFINLIEANIENEELDIDYICVELGISRTNLYNKLKSITGQPVGDFVRGIRLRKAAQILATQDSTVLEAMYSVGFQSKSYFAKAFRKEFGKSPSEFIESMKNKE